VKKSSPSLSLAGYKSLISCINTSWSTTSLECARSFLELSLTFAGRGNEGFLQPLCEIGRWWREAELPITLQVHYKSTNQWNASLCWSSRSMRSSTASKSSHRSDAQDQSNTIAHFLGQKNIFITTTANGIKLSTVGPSEGTWKNSSNRTFQKEYILTLEAVFRQPNTQPSREQHLITQCRTIDWLLKFQTYRAYFLPFLILCTQFLNKILFYAPNHCSTSIHPHAPLMQFSPRGGGYKIPPLLGFFPLRGLCLYALLMGFFYSEASMQTCLRTLSQLSYGSRNPLLWDFYHSKDCVCTLRWWDFPHSEGSIQTLLAQEVTLSTCLEFWW